MKEIRDESEIISSWSDEADILVSIVCPTFNHVEYISAAIDGFLDQVTSFPIEVIIYDDASTDGTSEVVTQYQKLYPGIIRHIRNSENQYSLGKRVMALAIPHAKGKYVAYCEGDDFWADPQKIQKQVEFLEKHENYVMTFHDCLPFNEHGNVDKDFGGAKKDLTEFELQKCHPIYTLTTCFRNVIQKFPAEYNAAKHGDLFLWSLLGAFGKGKYMGDIKPARYRVHRQGVHSMKARKHRYEMELATYSALCSYYIRVDNQELVRYFKELIVARALMSSGFKDNLSVLIWFPIKKLVKRFFRLIKQR